MTAVVPLEVQNKTRPVRPRIIKLGPPENRTRKEIEQCPGIKLKVAVHVVDVVKESVPVGMPIASAPIVVSLQKNNVVM